MVTAIGSNSKVFDMSQLPKACRPIDAKNSREESDKTALSLGIKLEDATIINISPCSASFLLQKSGNFEQFKSAKINQLRSETITISAIDVTINNYDEYASQRSEFESKVQSTDFEQEYKDYMKSRGCKNEEELQALNNTMYKTMDDLKRGAASGMTSVMMNMAIRNPEMTSARHNINSIISSSNVNDLADYVSASYSGLESNGKALQTLLSKAEDSGLDSNYLNKISSGIDDLFEQIKKELKEEAKTGEKFDYGKYQEAYQKKMIAQAYN